VLKVMLEVEGATVGTAEDGEAGLRVAVRMHPNIVLCDIGLPDIDGSRSRAGCARAASSPGRGSSR